MAEGKQVSGAEQVSEEKSKENGAKQSEIGNLDPSTLSYVDGKCFYKDPSSGVEYQWNNDNQQWENKQPDMKDYEYDGETYYYVDKVTNVKYKWDKDSNGWVATESKISLVLEDDEEEVDSEEESVPQKKVVRQDMSKGTYGTDGDTLTYTDPADGTVYVWDKQKSAWFPKVDEDFLAHYQLNYGFTNPDSNEEKKSEEPLVVQQPEVKKTEEGEVKVQETKEESLKRKAVEPAWFEVDDETNNKVYVSNLPTDITEAEFVELMQKCGLVMKDPDTGKMKVKLYTEPKTDVLKGDALCTYIKVESVGLALTVLDGYEFRGKKIHVERAKFTMKGGSYDPSLKPKKKKRKDIEKIKKMQEKLFDWRPEKMVGERPKNEKVVVVKNLFDPIIFDRQVSLILEYTEDLREECRKCGDVRKVLMHDRHPEGVAQVWFKEFEGAEACVQLLNGRWFGQRQITAEIWDGKTKYKIMETEEEIEKRIQNWDKFLDNDNEESKKSQNKDDLKKNDEIKDKTSPDTRPSKPATEKDEDSDATRSSAGSGDETDDGA